MNKYIEIITGFCFLAIFCGIFYWGYQNRDIKSTLAESITKNLTNICIKHNYEYNMCKILKK